MSHSITMSTVLPSDHLDTQSVKSNTPCCRGGRTFGVSLFTGGRWRRRDTHSDTVVVQQYRWSNTSHQMYFTQTNISFLSMFVRKNQQCLTTRPRPHKPNSTPKHQRKEHDGLQPSHLGWKQKIYTIYKYFFYIKLKMGGGGWLTGLDLNITYSDSVRQTCCFILSIIHSPNN